MQHGDHSDFRLSLTPLVKEALREVSAREGQTQAAFVKSCLLPFLRDEMRAIAARIQNIPSAKGARKPCLNCGAL